MTKVGPKLAAGRTADLFAYGSDSVVKVIRPDMGGDWAAIEFDLACRVHALDLPTPEPRKLVTVDGRPGVVFQRVYGQSMQTAVIVGDMPVTAAADLLCEIHHQVLALPAPPNMPPAGSRLAAKIEAVQVITETERCEARVLLDRLPSAACLLHGDLHPNNIILADSGPVIIDWYDAAMGHPMADIARSKLLMRSPGTELERHVADGRANGLPNVPYLPGATVELLDQFRARYLDGMSDLFHQYAVDDDTWRNWLAVTALGRVAEQVVPDDDSLVGIWRSRPKQVNGR